MNLKKTIKKMMRFFGFELTKFNYETQLHPDVSADILTTYSEVKHYTMTSPNRIFALCDAVKYIHEAKIEGDIVECGVWKGGSMMAVAKTLLGLQSSERHLYLFDTYEGMSAPTDNDFDISGVAAENLLSISNIEDEKSVWCKSSIGDVKAALLSSGYPTDKTHFIEGMVEETIPQSSPSKIALLRLDTDWYESTKHEMEHLFPLLAIGGVLIIDDYGHWMGAKKAVDEYFEENNIHILLNRIDYTGRIAVKVS